MKDDPVPGSLLLTTEAIICDIAEDREQGSAGLPGASMYGSQRVVTLVVQRRERMDRNLLLAAMAAGGVLLAGGFLGLVQPASAEVDRSTRVQQLLGVRYQTMLALAGYL